MFEISATLPQTEENRIEKKSIEIHSYPFHVCESKAKENT